MGQFKKRYFLFVADVSLESVVGGAERVLREEAVRLAKAGHAVTVITRKLPEHTSGYAEIEGVHEYRYEVTDSNPLTYLLSTIQNCQKLYKKISQDTSFDLINFHQPFSAYAIIKLKDVSGISKVYTCHSLSFEEYQTRNTNKNFFLKPIIFINVAVRKYIERFCLLKCRRIRVLSQFTRDKLKSIYSVPDEKIVIVPGGADIERFTPCEECQPIRSQLNIPSSQFVLFTVRNLVPRMGLENLIAAMSILVDKIPDCSLIIGGKGALKDKLESMIKEHHLENAVKLLGFVDDKHIVQYLQISDLFILPTIALEGFGLVTVEALACGTPVLGTPVGGTIEILSKFDNSFLFKDTSPESIADLINDKYQQYKNHPETYQELSKRCRAFAEKNYSWDVIARAMEEQFNQCVESAEK